jgi:hypothetical protein
LIKSENVYVETKQEKHHLPPHDHPERLDAINKESKRIEKKLMVDQTMSPYPKPPHDLAIQFVH